MSHAVTAFVAFILTSLLCAQLQLDTDRGNIKAGVLVVDKKPYRLTPLDLQ